MRLHMGLFILLVACAPGEIATGNAPVVEPATGDGMCSGNPFPSYCLLFADDSVASLSFEGNGKGTFHSGDLSFLVTYSENETESVAQLCPHSPMDNQPLGTIRVPRAGGVAQLNLDFLLGAPVTAPVNLTAKAFLPEDIPKDIGGPMKPGPTGKWVLEKNSLQTTMVQHDELFIMHTEPGIYGMGIGIVEYRSEGCDVYWGRYDARRRLVEFPLLDSDAQSETTTTTFQMEFASDFTLASVTLRQIGSAGEEGMQIYFSRFVPETGESRIVLSKFGNRESR